MIPGRKYSDPLVLITVLTAVGLLLAVSQTSASLAATDATAQFTLTDQGLSGLPSPAATDNTGPGDDLQNLGLFGFIALLPITLLLIGFHTVSARKSRNLLRETLQDLSHAQSIFENTQDGIVITTADGTIVKANPAVCRITGYPMDEIIGNNPRMFSSGRQSLEFYVAMWHQLLKTGHWSGEIWNKRSNGEIYAQRQSISAIRDEADNVLFFVAVFTDMSDIKELEGELERIALYDPVTGLPNRVLLNECLSEAIRNVKANNCWGAVFFFDLDGFKDINDRFGHEFGDKLLNTVARRLSSQFRAKDALARIGGDEFVGVVADYETLHDYRSLAERVLAEMCKPVNLDGESITLSASLGVAAFSADSNTSPDQLLRQSDSAMYQSKLEGKNRYTLFNPKTEIEITAFNNKINELSQAIDNGELEFHYQPKVDVISGCVHSAEALVRWNHPQDGLRYPGSFLDATDNIGVSLKLDTWALESAFKTASAWRGLDLEIPISVNIDPRNLTSNWLFDTLKRLLAEHPTIAPSMLDIEVLENATAIGNVSAADAIRQCQQLGVSFSIDDFGTGYSTLTHLRRLPADHVKIDQSFVRAAIDSLDDLAIVDAVLGLAGALNREVIAEGVETKDHQNLLISLGTSVLQGYSLARPMPLGNFMNWATKFQPDRDWTALQHLSKRHVKLLYLQVDLRNWMKAFTGVNQSGDCFPCHHSARQLATIYWPWLNEEGKKLFGISKHYGALLTQCENLMNRTQWHSDRNRPGPQACSVRSILEMSELAGSCIHTIDDLLLDRELDYSGTLPFPADKASVTRLFKN